MTSFYTHEDLVQYLYKETSTQKSAAIEAALQQDWTLRETLQTLLNSARDLNTCLESPRMEVVSRVLNYARDTVPESI